MATLTCQICNGPLSDGEISLDRQWHFDCEKCQICNQELKTSDRIRKCLDSNIPVSHLICFHAREIDQIRLETIPATQSTLDAVNEKLLVMRHSFEPPITDLTQLQSLLSSITSLGVTVTQLLDQTKSKIKIHDSQDYAEQVKAKKAIERKKTAERDKSAERAAILQAERKDETGLLKDKRKAIESLTRAPFNMTIDQATIAVEASFKSKAQ